MFEICHKSNNQHVAGEPYVKTYKKAVWRVNELNGVKNEGFEPLE